jgi:hypothetical protein
MFVHNFMKIIYQFVRYGAKSEIIWLQAVEMWNSVSEQLQEVVSACMEADLEEVSHEDATQQHFILSTDEDRLLDDAQVGSCERCMSRPGGGLS